MPEQRKRASIFEIVGAWLHVWTPPRDVEVPPVPWRKLLLFGVPALLLLAAGTWYVFDEGSETREANERVEAQQKAERTEARRDKLRREQAAHRASVGPNSRPGLVHSLEAAILEDAQERVRTGDLGRSVRRVNCEPHPRTAPRRAVENDPSRTSGRYYCLAVNRRIVGIGRGFLGYPFLARIFYEPGKLVWCKITPVPGEQVIADPRTILELPKACL